MKKILSILFVIIFVTACEMTHWLWKDYYEEDFKEFLIGRDGYSIAFLGKNYHYIFYDNSGILKEILYLNKQRLVSIDDEASYFKVSNNNDLSGYIIFKTHPVSTLKVDELGLIQSLGFRYDAEELEYILKLEMHGKRYAAYDDRGSFAAFFNRDHTVKIHQDLKRSQKFERAALTPITVTVDSVLGIGEVIYSALRDL